MYILLSFLRVERLSCIVHICRYKSLGVGKEIYTVRTYNT